MPTVNYNFNLPEEQVEFEVHCKAQELHAAICSFANHLRSLDKYQDERIEAINGRELLDEILDQWHSEVGSLMD